MSALVVVPFVVLYAWGLRRARRRPGWAALAWLGGAVALAVATSPWLDDSADQRLSWHMVQHEVIGMVAAPLLAAGAPVRLAFAASGPAARRRLARLLRRPPVRLLARPATGIVAFVAVLGAVHLPAVYDLTLRSPVVHGVVHAALLWSAILLWLPLIAADPLPHRASAAETVAALLVAMGATMVLGALLAAEDHVLYAPYATRASGALADQHLAGGLMSVGGMLMMAPVLAGLAWRALLAEERRATLREARGLPAGGAR